MTLYIFISGWLLWLCGTVYACVRQICRAKIVCCGFENGISEEENDENKNK